MALSTSVHDLKTLVLSFHSLVVIETVEEDRVRALLGAIGSELRMPLFEWSVTKGLTGPAAPRGIHGTSEGFGALRHLVGLTVEALFWLQDFSGCLDHPATVRQLREVAQRFAHTRSTVFVTGPSVSLPAEVEHLAVHYDLALPSEGELQEAVQAVVGSIASHRPVAPIPPRELGELVRALRGMTLNQARQVVARTLLEDGRLAADDIRDVLERKAQTIRESGLLEYFPAEDNRFELGGFARLKAWLERARLGFSERARELDLSPPRGILLVGVQGCGKSLAAKFIARQWTLPLLKLDAGRLYDKYVGESEKNLRRAIDLAESMAPTLLWIDEIEKGFSPSGPATSDGGLAQRVFGTFLTWLQEKRAEVFVVATANDVFRLPPELLRKGRFDEIFFVDLPRPQERATIFTIHLRRRRQDPARFDMARLVEQTEGWSGAEIEQAVIAAAYRALHENRPLETGLILTEIGETRPLSVSRREDIARLRELALERFVPVV
jgi:hypothetical protein